MSTELTTKGFIDQMKSLDYPIVKHLLSGDLLFVPVYPLIGKAIPRATRAVLSWGQKDGGTDDTHSAQ